MTMINIWQTHTQQNPEDYEPVELPINTGSESDVIYCPFSKDLFIQVDVTGLSAGESVSGRVMGSLDGVGYDNLSINKMDTVISENGTTLMKLAGGLPPYIKVTGFSAANVALQFHMPVMI